MMRRIAKSIVVAAVLLAGCIQNPSTDDVRRKVSPSARAQEILSTLGHSDGQIHHPEAYLEPGRDFPERQLLSMYSQEEIRWWADRGDQVSQYLMGRSESASELRLSYFTYASQALQGCVAAPIQSNSCRVLYYDRREIQCSCGLPEAQFELGKYLVESGRDNEAIQILRQSYLGGSRQAGEMLLDLQSRK